MGKKSILYYYVNSEGKREGPFSREDFTALGLSANTLVWREGLTEWVPFSSLEEFRKSAIPSIPTFQETPHYDIDEAIKDTTETTADRTNHAESHSDRIVTAEPSFLETDSNEVPFASSWERANDDIKTRLCTLLVQSIRKYRQWLILGGLLFVVILGIILIVKTTRGGGENIPAAEQNIFRRDVNRYAQATHISHLRTTSARINGVIHNNNTKQSIRFKYSDGEIVKYAPIKERLADGTVYCEVNDLAPNTPYAYSMECVVGDTIFESSWLTFATLPIPQPITLATVKHSKRATSLNSIKGLKGNKLRAVEACDYTDSAVVAYVNHIVRISKDNFNLGHVCDIFDYCYDHWVLVERRGNPSYQSASFSIENELTGNANDFAVVVCSLLTAVGGEARLNIAIDENGREHTYTEINLGFINLKEANEYLSRRYNTTYAGNVNYSVDQFGHQWLNLDFLSKHPGGDYYESIEGTRIYLLSNYCESF